ncbi:MAG: sugar transferase, partial [Alphaproteobacteria bacterium]|nr:sugar transferase [Alphaproteobacteria bacterium]
HYFFDHDVMMLTYTRGLDQFLPRLIKRGFDILAAGGALLFLSPVMLVVALLVKSDGGSVLFGHARIGCNGKPFLCLKFRTMKTDGDAILTRHLAVDAAARAEWQSTRKLRHDPRITHIGHLLRRTSLDEIPQFINVLRGHMSLVGPRPIVGDETGKYDCDIAYYYRVRPGITGLWQVSGRSDVSYERRVHMDTWYVRNWSLWHDIAIICKTFPALLRAGAY